MKVLIKEFAVDMEVKSKGIEFEVRSPDGSKHLGDCYITKTSILWCRGKTPKAQWRGDHLGAAKNRTGLSRSQDRCGEGRQERVVLAASGPGPP